MKEIEIVAKALPKEAWNKLAETTCNTFEKLIYPLTATTEGIGKLIQTKFESLNVQQQIIAAKCLEETSAKIKYKQPEEHVAIKPLVIYEALENTDQQTDNTIRSLWSNLLAREFTEGSIHPEIAKILSKITSQDALLLLKIAEKDAGPISVMVLKAFASKITLGLLNEKRSFNHVHLENLDLIQEIELVWRLTTTGREFMRCVSDLK
ncbi:MAG: Abi-alpha family protein [Pseudomonadota bacterium]